MNQESEESPEEIQEDPQASVTRAYRRAGLGLAIVAVIWTIAFFVTAEQDGAKVNWLIPIAAAALSVLCFSRYRKLKESQE
ncbi:MAG TPA: hypothetical protein VGB07_29055 [Blastocatellia bacterium]|jgi:hypothetical protein